MRETRSFMLFLILLVQFASVLSAEKKAYVVYMGDKLHENHEHERAQIHSFAADVLGSSQEVEDNMIHTYKRSFRGFSAMLTKEQATQMKNKEGVISMFPSKAYSLHTTRSWDFLGSVDSFRSAGYGGQRSYTSDGQDVIIGVLDTGIWPESESFKDDGMPPVPRRWKGICQPGEQFTASNCNKKLIGARFYTAGFDAQTPEDQKTLIKSPRDSLGHGTHTSSTAAGRVVPGVSFPGGIAAGTARGGSPNSRIAMYKVCWEDCQDADILAAFDDAIADGVDLLSLSLGPDPPQPDFFHDSISIGSFHAVRKNIFVACSAGNAGLPASAINLAPWILTVGASSVDRKFQTLLTLGNHQVIEGQSINPLSTPALPLARGSDLSATGVPAENASFCLESTLDPVKTKGKVVICQVQAVAESRGQKSVEVHKAGGVGMIVVDGIAFDVAQTFLVPAASVKDVSGQVLEKYLRSTEWPTVAISRTGTLLSNKPSPKVAVFSSRGPNILNSDIIKPDIIAPGVSIIAAWAPIAKLQAGNRTVNFNFQSGTSMACPHITGVAALLKARFPAWTPAMIKSAIMTTAVVTDNTNSPIMNSFSGSLSDPYDFGSGQVNLVAAADPGLVYDISGEDYLSFVCGLRGGDVRNLTSEKCPEQIIPAYNLNYPSIGISSLRGQLTVSRTLTNVAPGSSEYKAVVVAPDGVAVYVSPPVLKFRYLFQKQRFTVTFVAKKGSMNDEFGSLTWTDGNHSVRSPIALTV